MPTPAHPKQPASARDNRSSGATSRSRGLRADAMLQQESQTAFLRQALGSTDAADCLARTLQSCRHTCCESSENHLQPVTGVGRSQAQGAHSTMGSTTATADSERGPGQAGRHAAACTVQVAAGLSRRETRRCVSSELAMPSKNQELRVPIYRIVVHVEMPSKRLSARLGACPRAGRGAAATGGSPMRKFRRIFSAVLDNDVGGSLCGSCPRQPIALRVLLLSGANSCSDQLNCDSTIPSLTKGA